MQEHGSFINGISSISIILLKKYVIHAQETDIDTSPFKWNGYMVSILRIRFKVGLFNGLHDVNVRISFKKFK
jgi:hypothetical protein